MSYTYGPPGATDNGAGRVTDVEDGARIQSLTYDPLGSVVSETSTMKVHNLDPNRPERDTYTTEFTYDGFGRLLTLTYPDGELLTHGYDSGGLLDSVAGEKAGFQYPYVDRLEYDEFLVKAFQQTGNGVQTEYAFNDETRRMERLQTETPVREIQDWNYTHDLVGNVLAAANLVPPPTPSLMGGPSAATYEYDPYYRIVEAAGEHTFGNGKVRRYTYAISYGDHGNIVTKDQTDDIFNSPTAKKGTVQKPTTYSLDLEYEADRPHVLAHTGERDYQFGANGLFERWDAVKGGQNRSVTWDATNRVRSVADQGGTTDFLNDEAGRLAIERGPQGETAFVNQWYTARNGAPPWKHIWAGDDRIGIKRSAPPCSPSPCGFEHMGYFLHKDLQGSTNMITDQSGLVFQHLLYFPTGEIWVQEHSTVHRTNYLYAGGYFDEYRELLNFGQRWYEPRDQLWYSPDPLLQEDPWEVIDDPSLLPAYSYAGANPLRLADIDGRAPNWTQARPSASLTAPSWKRSSPFAVFSASRGHGPKLGAAREAYRGSRLWKALVRFSYSERAKSLQAFADRFEAKPLVEVSLVKSGDGWGLQDVKVSPTFGFKQFTVAKGKAGQTQAQANAASTPTSPGANTGTGPGATTPSPTASPAAAGPPPGGTGGVAAGNTTPPQAPAGPSLGSHRGAQPPAQSSSN